MAAAFATIDWLMNCCESAMRSFLVFAAFVGLGALYLWQKHHDDAQPVSASKPAQVSVAQPTPAPRGQASEYNWMKRSLDRAADVRDQARARTKEAQDP
jgi:hypothetical protein